MYYIVYNFVFLCQKSDEENDDASIRRSNRSRKTVDYTFKEFDEDIDAVVESDKKRFKSTDEPEKRVNGKDISCCLPAPLHVDNFYSNHTSGRRTRRSRRLTDLEDGSDTESKGSDFRADSSDDERTQHPRRHVYLRRRIADDSEDDKDDDGDNVTNDDNDEENDEVMSGKADIKITRGCDLLKGEKSEQSAVNTDKEDKQDCEISEDSESESNGKKKIQIPTTEKCAEDSHKSTLDKSDNEINSPKTSSNVQTADLAPAVAGSFPGTHTMSEKSKNGENFNGHKVGPFGSNCQRGPTPGIVPPSNPSACPLTTNHQWAPPDVAPVPKSPAGFPFNPSTQNSKLAKDGTFGVTPSSNYPFSVTRCQSQSTQAFGQPPNASKTNQFGYDSGNAPNQFQGQQNYNSPGNNFGAEFRPQSSAQSSGQQNSYSTSFTDFLNFGTNYPEQQSGVPPFQKSSTSTTQSFTPQAADPQYQGLSQYQQSGFQTHYSPSNTQFSPSHTSQQYSPRMGQQFSQQQMFAAMNSQYASPPVQQSQFPFSQTQAPYSGSSSRYTNMAPVQTGASLSNSQYMGNNRTYPGTVGAYFPPNSGSTNFDPQNFS